MNPTTSPIPDHPRRPEPMASEPSHHDEPGRGEPDVVEPDRIVWRTSPIDRRGFGIAAIAFALATTFYVVVGLAIIEWWDTSRFGEWEADLAQRFEAGRTSRMTTVAHAVSHWSDTLTKVLLGVALIPIMLWLFRRWHEWTVVFGALILEVCVFGLSSTIVGRPRPPVEQLDGAPTDSFPSGHIAAATAFYAGLAVIIFMRTERRGPRIVGVVVGVGMPIAVAWSRMYLGMHYLTDAVAGMALGGLSLIVAYHIVHRTLPDRESPAEHDRVAARIGGAR